MIALDLGGGRSQTHANGASIGLAVFVGIPDVTNGGTHRERDHAIAVAMGRIFALRACDTA